MKLNLGIQNWKKAGWETLDHHKRVSIFSLRYQAWDMPYPDNYFEQVFTSHMVEHIPSRKIEQTIVEINRVMKPGGILRILTPDLRKLATAYVNNDSQTMQKYVSDDSPPEETPYSEIGLGALFMNFILSPGLDNIVITNDYSQVLCSYAHMYCYDFEMLSKLLEHYGFRIDLDYCNIERSHIDHKDLRSVPYDSLKSYSLVIECTKVSHVPFNPEKPLVSVAPYNHAMLSQESWPLKAIFRILGQFYDWYFLIKSLF